MEGGEVVDGSGEEGMKGGWKGLLDKMGAERSERAGEGEARGGAGLIGNRAKQNKEVRQLLMWRNKKGQEKKMRNKETYESQARILMSLSLSLSPPAIQPAASASSRPRTRAALTTSQLINCLQPQTMLQN